MSGDSAFTDLVTTLSLAVQKVASTEIKKIGAAARAAFQSKAEEYERTRTSEAIQVAVQERLGNFLFYILYFTFFILCF